MANHTNQTTPAGQCPVMHGAQTTAGSQTMQWWPKALLPYFHGPKR